MRYLQRLIVAHGEIPLLKFHLEISMPSICIGERSDNNNALEFFREVTPTSPSLTMEKAFPLQPTLHEMDRKCLGLEARPAA